MISIKIEDNNIDLLEITMSNIDIVINLHKICWLETYKNLYPSKSFLYPSSDELNSYWAKKVGNNINENYIINFNNIAIGFISFGCNGIANNSTELFSFYILKYFQRNKIGTEIFSTLFHRNPKFSKIIINVLSLNPSLDFYFKIGGQVKFKSSENFNDQEMEVITLEIPTIKF
ncbi:MAG: hypothetical protein KA797_05350 [Chitinophagales bacterium]|nr:hypothetical protein [Chitinophagales bacterium]